jgi:hypothetical protein
MLFRLEQLDDPENKIVRPLQVYSGSTVRDYVPIEQRTSTSAEFPTKKTYSTITTVRRNVKDTPSMSHCSVIF